MNLHDPHRDSGESEHAELVVDLGELAERDRLSIPANLTDRLYLRTQANIARRAGEAGPGRTLSRLHWAHAAAALLIVASAVAVVLSLPRTPHTPPAQPDRGEFASQRGAEFNFELVDGSIWGDSLDGQIDVLAAESTMLAGEIDREWDDLDYLSDGGAL